MSTFIFISMILHAVSIYFIFILWKRNDDSTQRTTNSVDLEEIEIMLEDFSQKIKDENDQLKSMILKYQDELIEKNTLELNQEQHDLHKVQESTAPDEKTVVKDKETNEVLLLAKQGYNATEIAQRLNRGKGEVELLLKFYA